MAHCNVTHQARIELLGVEATDERVRLLAAGGALGPEAAIRSVLGQCTNLGDIIRCARTTSHRNFDSVAWRNGCRGHTRAGGGGISCRLGAVQATTLAPPKQAVCLAVGRTVLARLPIAVSAVMAHCNVTHQARIELLSVKATDERVRHLATSSAFRTEAAIGSVLGQRTNLGQIVRCACTTTRRDLESIAWRE